MPMQAGDQPQLRHLPGRVRHGHRLGDREGYLVGHHDHHRDLPRLRQLWLALGRPAPTSLGHHRDDLLVWLP